MTSPSAIPEPLREALFPRDVVAVLERLKQDGHKAYLVGGSVRDLLLGKPAKDYDVATSARAEQVQRLFKRVVPTGIKHGTVTVLMDQHALEVTTFRGEGEYHDGRRPSEVFFLDDVKDDLARRDFTMNAMAFDPTGPAFVDPFGGADDLRARRVRCVGEARQRFAEDGLRPLRAVRFASVLGFDIEPATFAAIAETLPTFHKIAAERVREELTKLLAGPAPARGVKLLRESGLLVHILPEVDRLYGATVHGADAFGELLRRLDAAPAELDLRVTALYLDVAGDADQDPESARRASALATAAMERLRYPRRDLDLVALLVREQRFARVAYASDGELRKAVARVGVANVDRLLAVGRLELTARNDDAGLQRLAAFEARVRELLAQQPPLTPADLALDGNQLMAILGRGPGPHVGQAVRFLLEQVLEDPSLNNPEGLQRLLANFSATPRAGRR